MAARLYLTNSAAGFTPATIRGAWSDPALTGASALSKTKAGAATTVNRPEISTLSTHSVLLRRFVSSPINNPASLSGTAALMLGVAENDSSMNAVTRVHLYVTVGSTDVVRGTLTPTPLAGTAEWPYPMFGASVSIGQGLTIPSLTAVDAQIGDRVVLEVGYKAVNTSAVPYVGQINYGGTGADLSEGSTAVDKQPGWIEFASAGFTSAFGPPVRSGGTVVQNGSPTQVLTVAMKVRSATVVQNGSPVQTVVTAGKGAEIVQESSATVEVTASRTSNAGTIVAEAFPTVELEASRTSDAGILVAAGSPTQTPFARIEGDVDQPPAVADLIEARPRPRIAHPLRFIAQDIRTGRWLDWDLPLVDPEITWTLSGPTVIRAKLVPEYRSLAELGIDAWSTWIHVEDDGEIIASGILQPTSVDGESYKVEALGVSAYAQKIPYFGEDSFVETDTCVVLRKIWDHLQSYPDAKLGVQITGSTACGTLLGVPAQAATDPTTGETQTTTSTSGAATEGGGGSGTRPAWGVPAGMKGLLDQDTSDSQLPWKIPAGADHVEIWFQAPASAGFTAEWWGYVRQGADVWNKSPALDVRVTQGAVPAGKNKVTMRVVSSGDDGNFDAVEKGGFTTGGDIQLLKSLGNTPNGGARRNVTCHEMGHGVGLVHRKTKHVMMNADTYPDVFTADDVEYKNLLYVYGKQLPGGHTAGGSAASAGSTTTANPSATVVSTVTDPATGVQTVTYSDGSTKTLTPKVDEAKPYVLAWYDERDCGAEFDNLAKAAGVDYVERAGWDPTRTFVNHAIELAYPRAGRKRLDLRCALDENLLDAFVLQETPAQFASQILVRGAGKGRAAVRGYAGTPDPKRVRRVAIVSDQTIPDAAAATLTAADELLRRQAAITIGEITVEADHPDMPLGSYQVGDDVLVTATLPYVGRVDLWHRIVEYTWRPDAGQVVATVRRSEQFAYGRRPTALASGVAGGVGPDKFLMAFGSGLDGDAPVFKTISELSPDYLALLGDLWRDDGGSGHLEHWQKALNTGNLGALVGRLPNPPIVGLSAHEGFAPNATAGPAFDRANIDYRRLFPGLKLLGDQLSGGKGIYRRIDRGRVRIIQLDMRTFKSPNDAPDDPAKTMLGQAQKDWFKAMLGSPCYPVIIVIGDMPWNSPKVDGADSWSGYTTERAQLAAAYQASPAKIIVQLEGGAHSLAKASNAGGIDRVWRAAPLRGPTDVPGKGEGYAENYPTIATAGPVAEQFGLVTVTDTGQQITLDFKGYSGGQVKMTDSISIAAPSGTPVTTPVVPGGTPTGGTASSVSQLLKIGKQTGWSKFNIGIGYSGSSHRDSDLTAIQNGLVVPSYFELTPDKQRARLSSHLDGGKTSSNTNYPRTEFRELGLDGVSKASWNPSSGTHTLFCRGRVVKMPPNKPQLCLAQSHDASDDTGMIYVNSRSQVIAKNRGENIGTLTNSFQLGVDYEYGIRVTGGQIQYFWGNLTTPKLTHSVSGSSGWYFKAGCYGQSNSSTDKTSDGPFIVEMSRLMCTHSGYPNPVG